MIGLARRGSRVRAMPAGMPTKRARPSPRKVNDKNSSVCGQNVSWLRAHAFARSLSMILSEPPTPVTEPRAWRYPRPS